MTERLRFDTTILDLDSAQLRDLVKHSVIIFSISTTGQGDFPQNARAFWKALLSSALRPGLLRKVCFTSFGLGDSSYPKYNVAHRMLHGRLVQLGAKPVCERGEGNEQHPEGHSAGFRTWIVQLKQQLMDAFPLAAGTTPIADDTFVEPKWKLSEPAVVGNGSNYQNGASPLSRTSGYSGNSGDHNENPETVPLPDGPSTTPLPVKDAYGAEILHNRRVTTPDHFQDVRLLDLRLDRSYDYAPGAVAVIYPKNFTEDVNDFIKLMSWDDQADVPLAMMSTSSLSPNDVPSPLRHLDFSQTTLTLRWLLENVLDIMSIPRRSFFASLAYFAGEETEDEKYQKERLLELANPELIDELWDYTTRPKRTILEVMMDFTTIRIPWQYALSVLPIMRGRQFSIASGGALKTDAHGHTKVELLIAIADPPSPIIKWRRRYGVCTRYIATLQPGQLLNIGMQQGYLDVQPSELNDPVLLIGPGTGVAPMRSMIYQRLAWAREDPSKPAGSRLRDTVLMFGCRSSTADHFFCNEWTPLVESEGLQAVPAFSRDPSKPKQYVQDLIRGNAALVVQMILQRRGKVYVCGSSGNMPKGVREALLDVFAGANVGGDGGGCAMGREEAEIYVDRMEKEGRYKQETW